MSFQVSTIGITLIYMAAVGLIAVYVRRSAITAAGYTEGGRQFPAIIIGFLMVSEFIGTPVSVGTATPGRSEEHTSELQSLMRISYAGFGLQITNQHTKLI